MYTSHAQLLVVVKWTLNEHFRFLQIIFNAYILVLRTQSIKYFTKIQKESILHRFTSNHYRRYLYALFYVRRIIIVYAIYTMFSNVSRFEWVQEEHKSTFK